jgi:putative tricarboxylic transport membrane protein
MWTVRDFPELPGGYPGPALFPSIIGALCIVFGLALLGQVLRGTVVPGDQRAAEREPGLVAWSNALSLILAVPAYLLLAARLGFLLSMTLLSSALMLKLRVRPLVAVVTSVAVATVASYVFADVLRVPLPRGPLGR